ncbi:MAG: thioester reductase-like protein [Myxococcota bacterium]|jgi:thioester reductase-like protein
MSETVFLTGATGYLGSYIADGLLREHPKTRLALLVRAESKDAARKRLWKSLQMHMDFDTFLNYVDTRVDIYLGDLTRPDIGLSAEAKEQLTTTIGSVIHCAASLNRKSAKSCFNVNLRGTLEIIKLARTAHEHHGLRRFSDISTVAVCGKRHGEVVTEPGTVEWDRSDYDPYARTKKFCEHMLHELLPDVNSIVFRPSIILGDSRFPETTQFDMVRAFTYLAQMPVLPFDPDWRVDIVPADYVSKAVYTIHMKKNPKYDAYSLASGTASLTFKQVTDSLERAGHKTRHRYVKGLNRPFDMMISGLSNTPKSWGLAPAASLMKVFLPYLEFDTVFDNSRVVEELGEAPKSFDAYAYPLLQFALAGGFTYPYKPWPETDARRKAA